MQSVPPGAGAPNNIPTNGEMMGPNGPMAYPELYNTPGGGGVPPGGAGSMPGGNVSGPNSALYQAQLLNTGGVPPGGAGSMPGGNVSGPNNALYQAQLLNTGGVPPGGAGSPGGSAGPSISVTPSDHISKYDGSPGSDTSGNLFIGALCLNCGNPLSLPAPGAPVHYIDVVITPPCPPRGPQCPSR